jgi:hypothetical protein
MLRSVAGSGGLCIRTSYSSCAPSAFELSLLNVTRGPEGATFDSEPISKLLPKDRVLYPGLALQAINLRTPAPALPHPPAVIMHTHIPPLKFLLFIFSLFCSALSQDLSNAATVIVEQRLAQGATHRSAPYHISFLSSW